MSNSIKVKMFYGKRTENGQTTNYDRKRIEPTEVIQRVKEKQLMQKEAGEMLGVSERQIRRMLSRIDRMEREV